MDEYKQANLNLWNEWAALHAGSNYYGVGDFKAGKPSLHSIELAELGDVTGKSLLHLQCHFGLDSLSWARLGARVTGVDFSDQAIALARGLAVELGIPARFVQSDVLELARALPGEAGTFDVVFTSYGVLCWLPDMRRWAEVIAHFLRPGGTFYIVEFHPFAYVFDDRDDVRDLSVAYPYFHQPEPMAWEVQGSYADRTAQVAQKTSYEWVHSLGDIVSALAGAGLRIEFLHEFPFAVERMLPFSERGDDGWWWLPGRAEHIPLMFSLRATK